MQTGAQLRVNKGPDSPTDSAAQVIAIVPSDVTPLVKQVRAIRAGGAGNITFVSGDGTDDVIAVAADETVQVKTGHVKATGTTAINLQGLV